MSNPKNKEIHLDDFIIKIMDIKKEIRLINMRIEKQNAEIERVLNLHSQILDIIRMFSAMDDDEKAKNDKK